MAVDIAVCVLANQVELNAISRAQAVTASHAEELYAVIGPPTALCAGNGFFALWSDANLSLVDLCAELSTQFGRIYICWKAEHGGVAGLTVLEYGVGISSESDGGANYLMLPSAGLEKALGIGLPIRAADRIAFPEILIEDGLPYFGLRISEGQWRALPGETITALLEGDLGVEPVLPVDL